MMDLNGLNASEDDFFVEVGPFVGFEGAGFLNLLYGLWMTGLGGSELTFKGSESVPQSSQMDEDE